MKEIIINADDFGINEHVTKEIEKAIENGSVSSTTVMANGKCLKEAAAFAKDHPYISYGAHICLSEFESITKSSVFREYGLLNEDGQFVKKAIFQVPHFTNELKIAIRDEIKAQIQLLKSYGFQLSHCDSHHHVHTIFGLHHIFYEILKEEGFDKLRIARNVVLYNLFRHPFYSQKQQYVNRYYKKRFKTTDLFCSYSEYLKDITDSAGDTIELMCHPGHPLYDAEYKLVMDKRAFLNNDAKLISYLEL